MGAGIERVVGTGARDELTGTADADNLLGRGGDDRLAGGLGADTYAGGAGNLIGQDASGIVSGGAGNPTARGDAVTQVADRAVISDAGQIAPGTGIAGGVGGGTPVAPIVSTAGGG